MTLERFDALKGVPENQSSAKQRAIEDMERLFTSAGLKDLGPKVEGKKPQEFRPFTNHEGEALIKDGAFILGLKKGDTIEDQNKIRGRFRYITGGGNRLLKARSTITEVAIYPDPERFFIPNTGGKDLSTQEKLTEKDAEELRKRIGSEDLDEIIPDQASTLTGATFKYLDETTKAGKGVWLFGPDYDYLYGRTKNPVNESGSYVAVVGGADPGVGVSVNYWDRVLGNDRIRVVRLVVARKK